MVHGVLVNQGENKWRKRPKIWSYSSHYYISTIGSNKKKKVASIDINCINYKKVIQFFEKKGVEMQEESEDVTVDEKE